MPVKPSAYMTVNSLNSEAALSHCHSPQSSDITDRVGLFWQILTSYGGI